MSQRKRVAGASQSSQGRLSGGLEAWDEDDNISFTQPSSSQVQRRLERITPAQVDRKMAEVVQFILIKDQKKVPIKRTDIVKHVIKEYRNVYTEIMKRASRTLEQVFGLKLVEIDTKNHVYILINKLEPMAGDPTNTSPGNPRTALLFVILSVIFMKGGAVKESVIWNTLKKLRVDQAEKHEDFGDVKKLVTEEFVRQNCTSSSHRSGPSSTRRPWRLRPLRDRPAPRVRSHWSKDTLLTCHFLCGRLYSPSG